MDLHVIFGLLPLRSPYSFFYVIFLSLFVGGYFTDAAAVGRGAHPWSREACRGAGAKGF